LHDSMLLVVVIVDVVVAWRHNVVVVDAEEKVILAEDQHLSTAGSSSDEVNEIVDVVVVVDEAMTWPLERRRWSDGDAHQPSPMLPFSVHLEWDMVVDHHLVAMYEGQRRHLSD